MKRQSILITAVVGIVIWFLGAAAPTQAAPFVYVANLLSGNVSQYDAASGGLSPLSPAMVAAGNRPFWVAVTPDGQNVYVTNSGDSTVSQYSVGAGGGLSAKSPATVAAGSQPVGVAASPDGTSVYVTDAVDNSVSQYSVGAGGGLSAKSPATVAAGSRPAGVAVSPDGQNVYVTNSGDNTVSQYSVGAGGGLSVKSPATIAAGSNPVGVAVSPDGRNVYVANLGFFRFGSSVSQYSVGPGGVLSAKSPAAVLGGNWGSGIAVSPDGTSVYVASRVNEVVGQLSVGADGTLSPNSQVTAGSGPTGVVVSPDGASVYVTNYRDNSVSQYSVFAGGVLSSKSPPTVGAGLQPEGIAIGPAALVPTTLAQCKHGGWQQFGFKSLGRCVAFVIRTRVCEALERHDIHLKSCPPRPPRQG